MTEIDNTFYIDDREKKNTKIIAGIMYDDIEVTHLDIGDVLMRGVIFEMKSPDDFVASVFDNRLFTQIANMTENYQHAFVLVHGTYFGTQLVYDSRSKVHNFPGIVASCIARGVTPLFADSLDGSLELIDLISSKCTDGKVRDRPVKRVSLKDKQIGIICSLPDVSDGRAKALLNHFGSINAILMASEKELCDVKGIGTKIARKIQKILQKPYIG